MIPSPYLKIYPDETIPGNKLLYSTKKASKVSVDQETLAAMKTGSLSPQDASTLSELGMITADPKIEQEEVLNRPNKSNDQNTTLSLTIAPNMDCNFACLYCYEEDQKGNKYMSEHTMNRVIRFIDEKLTHDKTSLIIDFYGGEPLLSMGTIKSIAGAAGALAKEKNAHFQFSLVTNGSLFKRRIAQELIPLGLTSVKVTIDGPAHLHDRFRPFTSGAGSFDIIIKNIMTTCDLVKIGIGGNFEQSSYPEFLKLLDFLEWKGLTPDKISTIKLDPIVKKRVVSAQGGYTGGCLSMNEPWLINAEIMLREAILKKGYETPKIKPMFCTFGSNNYYMINYNGMVYKCPALVGIPDFSIGDLQNGIHDESNHYNLPVKEKTECLNCCYLPLCMGGCRYLAYVKTGDIEEMDCQKAFLDGALQSLIQQEIKYGRRVDGVHRAS